MAETRIVCDKNNIDFVAVRMAMKQGARTVEEVKKIANVCGECAGCEEKLNAIIATACFCRQVSVQTVVEAVKNGTNTVEGIQELTQAGAGCGRCKPFIESIIASGK